MSRKARRVSLPFGAAPTDSAPVGMRHSTDLRFELRNHSDT
jgi:hypothetical protein